MFTLLIIEDEKPIRDMLQMYLESRNYNVLLAEDGKSAMQQLNQVSPDLLILDWMLPDTDGIKMLQEIRQTPVHQQIPILMLTARSEETDKVKGLDIGADDYMTKPVSLRELDARIRALLRRSQGLNQQQQLVRGDITLDSEYNTVSIAGETVNVSGIEFRLLRFFMNNPDRIYSRAQLLDHVWGQAVFVEERTVDVHVMRLRKILKAHGKDALLKTVRGLGYRFELSDSSGNGA